MNLSLQLSSFLPGVLALACLFMAGIHVTGNRTSSNGTLQESLLWGGGIIGYALTDYVFLMLSTHDCLSAQCSLAMWR